MRDASADALKRRGRSHQTSLGGAKRAPGFPRSRETPFGIPQAAPRAVLAQAFLWNVLGIVCPPPPPAPSSPRCSPLRPTQQARLLSPSRRRLYREGCANKFRILNASRAPFLSDGRASGRRRVGTRLEDGLRGRRWTISRRLPTRAVSLIPTLSERRNCCRERRSGDLDFGNVPPRDGGFDGTAFDSARAT